MAEELKGIDFLRQKLALKQQRVKTRYQFYDMKNRPLDFGISTPDGWMKNWFSSLEWCAKAVDSLADRLVFREFRDDFYNINSIFQANNPDIFFDSAITSALIASCCFVYIKEGAESMGANDSVMIPELQVLTAEDATGVIDTRTNLLTEGYAVLERDGKETPTVEAYFRPFMTEIYRKGVKEAEIYRHGVSHPLLVPVIFRQDASRPFGHSRISRACMSIVGSAIRTIKRSEISAEFYSYPQKYAVGVSGETEFPEKWRAAMSAMLTITKDEDGGSPTLGQFVQQSQQPHTDQLRMFASLLAGATGLTLDDMGFATENPSSSEAIKAAHENLRLTARKAQRSFGACFLNVGYLAACLRDKQDYPRRQFYGTKPLWEPIFESDMSTLSLVGDGAIKINQSIPGYFDSENLRDLTGIEPAGGNNGGGYSAEALGADLETVPAAGGAGQGNTGD